MDAIWIWGMVILGVLLLVGILFFGTGNIPSQEEYHAEQHGGQ